MGQILRGSAKTTHAVQAAIQRSKASIQELASRYDLNPKTVMKWRKRASLCIQFCELPKNRSGPTARWQTHMFDLLCRD